jgi:hypothetical protein
MEVCEMRARIYSRVVLVSAGLLLYRAGTSRGYESVVNYDNHPDLVKAKQYDLTVDPKTIRRADGSFDQALYDSYVAKASRELAEQHYLAYLQDVNDSFQRAAVYARLGSLYSGGTSRHVATTIDRDQARVYYRKALEAEPERIGWATLQARGFFATDAETREERFASYMDYYAWLLSIDAQTLKEKYLPTRPPGTRLPRPGRFPEMDEAMKKRAARMIERTEESAKKRPLRAQGSGGGMLGLIRDQADVTASNLVHEAIGVMAVDYRTTLWSKDRALEHLTILAERFPDTSAAKRAQAERARIVSGAVDYGATAVEKDLPAYVRKASGPTASTADVKKSVAETHERAISRILNREYLSGLGDACRDWKIRTMVCPSPEDMNRHRVTADQKTRADCMDWLAKFLRPDAIPRDLDRRLVAMANWGLFREEAEQKALLDVFLCRFTQGPYVVHIQESPFNVVISVADERRANAPEAQVAHGSFIIQVASALLHQDILPDPAQKWWQRVINPVDARAVTRAQWQPPSVVIEEPGRSWWSVDPKQAAKLGTSRISAETDGAYVRFDIIKATGGGPRAIRDPYVRRFGVSQ